MRLPQTALPCLLLALLSVGACERKCASPSPARTSSQDGYRQPERLVAALGITKGDAVAEIGAGGGYLTLRLAAAVGPTGQVVATDIDAAAISALRQRIAAEPGKELGPVSLRLVDPDDPGLLPDRFSLILLAQVDHLLKDRAAYLRALLPALRPGGRIAVANSERHRDAVYAAAASAGLRVEPALVELPAQFLLFLKP
jgi:ubiquinone/menaquinone biosynthesis C-methylase UbiE